MKSKNINWEGINGRGEGKRVKAVSMAHFLYKYEHGTLKPVEVTLRGPGRRENNGGD
jgi:hypothetical protein